MSTDEAALAEPNSDDLLHPYPGTFSISPKFLSFLSNNFTAEGFGFFMSMRPILIVRSFFLVKQWLSGSAN